MNIGLSIYNIFAKFLVKHIWLSFSNRSSGFLRFRIQLDSIKDSSNFVCIQTFALYRI